MDPRPVAAAFDLDGTLCRRDTFLLFLRFAAGDARFWARMAALSPRLCAYAVGRVSSTAMKEQLLARMLAELDDAAIVAAGERFAAEGVDAHLRPEAVARLRWHQQEGHRTALVSASLEHWVVPLGRRLGFDVAIGSRMDRAGGRVRLDDCRGPAKVTRLREAWGDPAELRLHAYGDSDGDRELLAAATHPWFRTFGDAP